MTTAWAYHATRPELVALILTTGLLPQAQAEPDEARGLDPEDRVTFFASTADQARCWGTEVFRFPWPADAEEDPYGDSMLAAGELTRTGWFTRRPVEAGDLAPEGTTDPRA